MNIWIDGYEANVGQRLGSSQVAFELLKYFEKIDKKNEYTIFLPNPPLEDLPKERVGWKYKILKPKRLWTQIALPLALYTAKQKPDIFFSPTHYIPRFSPIKRIATIFDLSFLHFPQMFVKKDLWKLTNWTKFSVQNANHIVTISNFSKKDIISSYQVNKDKITVAYPGFDKNIFHPISDAKKIEQTLKKYGIKDSYVFAKQKGKVLQAKSRQRRTSAAGSYIIYIGTIQPRKNLIRLMEVLARVEDITLVVVGKTKGEGKQGWLYQETLDTPKKLGIEDRVKFLGYVPNEDLQSLVSGAIAYIQPSLWEGFGIPVLEAMACGCPVIVSNVSSLSEVVGKSGLLIDPYSLDQIEQAIRTVVSDKKLREKYSKAGILQAKKFSWDKMARTVLKVFENI